MERGLGRGAGCHCRVPGVGRPRNALDRGPRGPARGRPLAPRARGRARDADVPHPPGSLAGNPAGQGRSRAPRLAAVARGRDRLHGEQHPACAGGRVRACVRRQPPGARTIHYRARVDWRGTRLRCAGDAGVDGAGDRVALVSSDIDADGDAALAPRRANGGAVRRAVRGSPGRSAAAGAVARTVRAARASGAAVATRGASRQPGGRTRGRPRGAQAAGPVRRDALLVARAVARERGLVRGVLPRVRAPRSARGFPVATGHPRVRGGRARVGGLFRRLREGHAADAADLRYHAEPGACLRGRLPRLHLPADHPARPAVPRDHAAALEGSACRWSGRGSRSLTDAVRVAAHAKLNLFLRILAREAPTGFHQIETAFALVELADELVVTRTAHGSVELTVHGPDLGPPEENLAVRAARAVLE